MNDDRREFLKKAGKAAVTAPAVAVLMSAGARQAQAGGGAPPQDDFISGERNPNPK
ncbi:MAG: hypothetical protein H6907_15060 [Hyphomicrobiales bacterium]|nr:hypothetical protein [Hyphomicrobiales bacterium]